VNSTAKTIVFWAVMLATALLLWQFVKSGSPVEDELSFTDFMTNVEQGNISEITLYGNNEVQGRFKTDNRRFFPCTCAIGL